MLKHGLKETVAEEEELSNEDPNELSDGVMMCGSPSPVVYDNHPEHPTISEQDGTGGIPTYVKKHLPLLEYLAYSKPTIQHAIVQECDPEIIHVICEAANTLLKGGVPISKTHKSYLKRYRGRLHRLTDKHTSTKRKRKILSGGFLLGSLLGTVIPPIIGSIGSLFGGK